MKGCTLRRIQPWLGTYVHVEASAPDPAAAEAALAAAFAEIRAIHEAMSFHSPASDLARLQQHAHQAAVMVDAHTRAVLELALRLADASAGAFDPTIAPQLVRAGILPAPAASFPPEGGNWRDITLHAGGAVSFRRPLWLDLGGIAKGYAVDCAVEALQQQGAHTGSVNAGGDLRVFGEAGLALAVRSPLDPARQIPFGRLYNGAAATSGDYFTALSAGTRVPSRIVDPLRGLRPSGNRSITVLAPQCSIADALTKIVSLQGAAAQPLLARFAASAAIIEGADTLHLSPGFREALGLVPSEQGIPHA